MKMEIKCRRIYSQKTYEYLYLTISKSFIETLNPRKAIIRVDDKPPITLPIRKWKDGRGYIVIPNDVALYFNLTPGQVVDVDFEF